MRNRTTFGRRVHIATLSACLAVVGSLFAAGSAEALQYVPHTLEKSFNGAESPGGPIGSVGAVAVDQQSGDVYVVTAQEDAATSTEVRLYKFNAQGEATAFTDPSLGGSSVIAVGATETCSCSPPLVRVDNSGGPHQGRIYVDNHFIDNQIWAFEPSGERVGGNFPLPYGPPNLAIEPTNGSLLTTSTPLTNHVYEFTSEGQKTERVVELPAAPVNLQVGPQGELFMFKNKEGILKFDSNGNLIEQFEYGERVFGVDQVSGSLLSAGSGRAAEFTSSGGELPNLTYAGYPVGAALNGVNNYIYVAFSNSVDVFAPQAAVTLPDASTEAPTNIGPTSLTLNGTVNPDGIETTECVFEYGATQTYGTTAPCDQGQAISGGSPTAVNATPTGLTQGGTYHYRLKVANVNGAYHTKDETVIASAPPVVENPYIDEVHSDSVVFHAEITPEGAPTTYHVLYGTADCATEPQACASTEESPSIGAGLNSIEVSERVTGLQAGTTYHYVVVVTNQSASVESPDETFTTFPYVPVLEDHCANAHVRQQTGAALLADCRAYELVSAANAGGYNVESYLAQEQEPYAGYPYAESPPRLLYGVNDGAIPGTGHPTNHGLDPYVATRGAEGWSTSYVGVPANLPYSDEAFASPLAGADASLDTFAFGGPGLCSPCFADGTTGIPVRLPSGSLVQGMAGSLQPGPSATANMLVKKPLSADGTHLIFGSTFEFEPGAGTPAIYDRDLTTGVTHAVSKLPNGGNIPCLTNCGSDGLAELDVSADGSHIVIGQLVSTDSAGNRYWHLYMSVGDSGKTVDLTPGASDGVLYDGMTEDGSKVFFTTVDRLTGEDTDNSADIYEAQVAPTGTATLRLVSKGPGSAGNADNCEPLGNSVNEHWNTTGSTGNCGVVAVGGGGGVAARDGSIYFLSPELLDGTVEPEDGVVNQPNLYVSRPSSPPQFVATLESDTTGPTPALEEHKFKRFFAQSPNPEFVAVDNSGGPSNGDVYVADGTEKVIRKYTSEGNLITSWGNSGELEHAFSKPLSGIAVGPTGTLYVAMLEEFNSGNDLFEFDESGTLVGENNVSGAPHPIGISVDGEGRVFYEGYSTDIERWVKGKGSTVISTGKYQSGEKFGLAVDPTSGVLYVDFGESIGRYVFDSEERVILPNGSPCRSSCEATEVFGASEVSNANEMFVDPTHHELYVNEGNKILRYHADGQRAPGPDTGAKVLSNSTSVAVSSAGNLYANNAGSEGASVAEFGPLVLAPDVRTDNPLVVDSVNDSGARYTGDFQITPSGDDAVFTSTISLTGYDNAGHEEVFRYDAPTGTLACVSCNPTNARATGEASLARGGLSLIEDGRVFFNSSDPLVPSDLDNREDVYEWENGKINLISTGLSPYNSTLLSASANGTDVFFFTRDTLVPQDQNGSLVKIYDAREGGGFPYTPPPVSCKASDECHGPGSPEPSPAAINTITGTSGNHVVPAVKEGKCRRGMVKRHGHCVKRHHRGHHRKHRHDKKRSGKRSRGQSRGGRR